VAELLAIGPAAAVKPPLVIPGTTTPAPPSITGLATYKIETWGCQMNSHDSEKMAGILDSLGLVPVEKDAEADLILLNTCSVREKAAQKVFTRLGQLRMHKRRRPHMVLGVCGCVAQQEQERIFARAPYVDLVMGPRRIASLPALIVESRSRRHALGVFDPRESLVPESAAVRRVSRTRAYVTVMEGCNKNCTFCIVPFTRGREACRPPEAILREVRECVHDGLVEVELLGQNVNAWRHGQSSTWDFTRLLVAAATVPGVKRVRFTTSHPLHFKNSIIDAMASHETLCKHLHLPVQSGSDVVLRRMRRGYTNTEYLDRIGRLRHQIPDVGLSTDIIVGFPGETEDDFEKTMQLVRQVRYDTIYSFIYSPRPHTAAQAWLDDVPAFEKKARLHRLQALQTQIQLEKNREMQGKIVQILVDGPSARSAGQVSGRTSQNHVVNVEGDPSFVGRFMDVRITRSGPHSLTGVWPIGHADLTSHRHENIDRPRNLG